MLTPEALGLSWPQRVKLKLSGHVYIEHRRKPDWKKALPHYLAKCKIHGFYIDYPHGGRKLVCPECARVTTTTSADLDEKVKQMALKLYEEKGIKPECERCFIVTDPQCPDFPHICALEEGLKKPDSKDWIVENLSDKIEMRKSHGGGSQ